MDFISLQKILMESKMSKSFVLVYFLRSIISLLGNKQALIFYPKRERQTERTQFKRKNDRMDTDRQPDKDTDK